jgi:DNA-binding transcriptional MerR regulator
MSQQKAKQLLNGARTLIERENAIQSAINLGMPIHEIQEYLDWLEMQESAKTESLVVGKSDAPKRTARSDTLGS